MAAETTLEQHLRLRRDAPAQVQESVLRRFIAAIEPWYDWGKIHIDRMQELRLADGGRFEAGGEGLVRYFAVQWLGLHVEFQIGRTPKAVR